MSEDAAYNRVAAARAVRRFPVILDHLSAGFVSVTAVKVLRPVLTAENHVAVLAEAKHRSRKDCERIVARLAPKPDVPSTIRALPAPAPLTVQSAPAPSVFDAPAGSADPPTTAPAPLPERRAVVAPLSPKRYRFEMTMDEETHDALRQLQDLLATEVPSGDPAAVVKRALLAHLREVRKKKRSATDNPRPSKGTREGSRDIPAHVARAVWERDGERCAFVAKDGRLCCETRYLQLHHIHPYGYQGPSTVENISVRCRAHNLYESELVYGTFQKPSMARERRENHAVSGRARAVPGRKPDVPAVAKSGP
jgi:5-methylcytosine-specific restriction endonuclease McrA